MPNRLASEKSPYLLQHARNPVDWYPWGEEAFAKARKEDKPVLLSIGYSTCHWCHVMERESFEDESIAEVMNRHFVCIKLDREERPDVDRIYMTAVQAMTGQGGWPLNAFLTPDLKPFFGGTYFPPAARWGQPGWPQLLERIAELWKTRRDALVADSLKLAEALQGFSRAPEGGGPVPAEAFARAVEELRARYDEADKGFGSAPKFPMPVNLGFLLRRADPEARRMALETLEAMARGGIYDQVGGGFHRYSTDRQWRVPHFEKMLYDNSQLAVNYLEAFQLTGNPLFSRIARETLDYVARDMTAPEGGFYSAEDADSQGVEGKFYVWTLEELREALGAQADAFIAAYGAKPSGNAPVDPHGEFAGKNILYLRKPPELASRAELLPIRSKRVRPGLDDKVITAWNGLMLSAYAKAAAILDSPEDLERARKAAAFLRRELWAGGRLHRRWRQGERKGPAFSDDYAFLVQGLLDLHEACGESSFLAWAVELHERQNELFSGPNGGLYMTAEGQDPSLLLRVMEDSDNVEPASSSVAALNGLRLYHMTGREDFRDAAEATLSLFGPTLAERPLSMPQMLVAAEFARGPVAQVVILAARADDPAAAAMRRAAGKPFLARRVILTATPDHRPAFLKEAKLDAKPAAYVCASFACQLPLKDVPSLEKALAEL